VTEPEPPVDAVEADPAYLVEVGVYASAEEGFNHGLVALTLGHSFWLRSAANTYRLLVEPHAAELVRQQLWEFERESLRWPPRPFADPAPSARLELVSPLLWCAMVLVSFWAQGEWTAWTGMGALDAKAVFERDEWWRLISALFLHGDVGHLVSNLASGIFVFSAVLTTIGIRTGWLLLTVASVGGNLAAAAVKYPGVYRSLGASTAIFAAVGLLTGRALRVVWRGNHPHRWRAPFVPLAAGLTVLALHGTGGQQVDVVAHVTGFSAGLALGWVAGIDKSARKPAVQASVAGPDLG
jgi:rhomboid protease GluP